MSDLLSSTRAIQQVLAAAIAVAGGDLAAAIPWYRNEPLALFDNRTAEALVSEDRAADVLNLLESIQAGFVG
uniref:antitoxin Xre/MbcA/ParS toxin-binding domain-containing protein n=1 Tax=unclassified Variovorax TaxID=663243 RepID=UPI000D3642F4